MAYQAFYNKYRPQTFEEVVGQQAIVTTLKNAIKEDKIAHAYLFCGPRGTGKTTMARLFAKALDCKEGLGHQCNRCDSCEKIMHGQHPDVIEIDAASNSTVDSVRQLIESVSYQPLLSRYKVYIIDEVHNMSDSAFNALLKTIEEPPSFVIFILATTDPQKVLPTILSRVQRFDFSKVRDEDLIKNMKRVLDNEHITYEEDALRLLSSLSDGGVRDSLSLLDKVVSYCGDHVREKDVNDLLGLLSLEEEINIINEISKNKVEEVLKTVKEHYRQGLDIRRFRNDLLHIYKDYLIYAITKDRSLLEFLKEEEAKKMHLTIEECRYDIDTLMQNIRDNRLSDDVYTQFELALITMMSPKPVMAAAPIVQSAKPEKKEEENKGKAIEIKSDRDVKAFVTDPKDTEASNDVIQYTKDDILYIMYHFDKAEKTRILNIWNSLENEFLGEHSFEAKALYGCKPKIFGENILIVTNPFPMEIAKLNRKNVQNTLLTITDNCFGKPINVLPITEEELKVAYSDYKNKAEPKEDRLNIDFGIRKNVNASTLFAESLINKED